METISTFLSTLVLIFCLSCDFHYENKNIQALQDPINPGTIIELDAESLLRILKYDKNAFVLDVRKSSPSIRTCKMIKGYQFFEDSLIFQNIDLIPLDRSIVLLSKTGERSRKLAVFLANFGISAYNLEGGMDSYWKWREQSIRENLGIFDKELDVIELYADDFGC